MPDHLINHLLRGIFGILRQLFQDKAWRNGSLVIQPLPGIGDLVWHVPHLHAIAAAEGPVTLLAKPRSSADGLLMADASVAIVRWLERPGAHSGVAGFFRLVALLRSGHYRNAWLLHGSRRYAWALLCAGVPRTLGYGEGMQKYLLSEPLFLPPAYHHEHPIDKATRFLALAGIPLLESAPRLLIDSAALSVIGVRLGRYPRPFIAFGIGSSEACKQWGVERFTELAAELQKETGGSIFLIGGAAERDMGDAIANKAYRAHGQVIALPPQRIEYTAALLASCALYIGNDTGALNIAAAVGVPAIGLFGASTPLRHSAFIFAVEPLAGSGMNGITVAQVLVAARTLLESA